ncbi:hypothetical protein GCM10022200_06180 [Microbacterium awajiense]|uniref:DUF6993 domain-containing protein n=1 Tax=Microbacterium awajiense TaxID=415214 RepID=A0ABP7A807_9MICO
MSSRLPAALRAGQVGLTVVALAAVSSLTGCVGDGALTPTTADASPTVVSSASPGAPSAPPVVVLMPEGSAADNLPVFAAAVDTVWDSDARLRGGAYVEALVAAGFRRVDMERTADLSTVGAPAESIQFSVQWAGECLIGQVGPGFEAPVTIVAPLLDEGRCLIGATVEIEQ